MDYGDSYIKHTMIVTKKTKEDVFLSYHSDDHLDEPLFQRGGIIARNRGARDYPFHIK